MAGMLEYKCPCCDGAIQFDSTTQKMKCPYCDTEFEVDTLKGYDQELKDEKPSEMEWTTPGGSWAEGETAGLHTYACKSCGGEIVGDRKWHISTCGYGITAFTDAGIQYLGQQMTPSMAEGDYAAAFRTFVQWSDTYIDAARAGHPYDVNTLPREPLSLMYLFLALGIGLVLAAIIVGVMKSRLRSVAFEQNAANYVREGSMNLTNRRELFLYRDVQRTKHVEEKDSDSSGGSSTHTSSSGTTHGGGGGSF